MNSFKNNGESGMTPKQLRDKMKGPRTHKTQFDLLENGWSGDTYTDRHGRTWVLASDGLSVVRADK